MSDVLEKEDVRTVDQETGDHDTFSHYAKKADILAARVEGKPCVALCGKKWVPTKDENQYPVCGTCKEIYEGLTQ